MRIQKFLRRAEASEYLKNVRGVRCAPSTLAKMACRGGGPTFRRIGPYPVYAAEVRPALNWLEKGQQAGPRMGSSSANLMTSFHWQTFTPP
jgi:hypothetical protein